jgi:hypothetical protein
MSRNRLGFVALVAAAAVLVVPMSNAAKPSSSGPTLSVTFSLASASVSVSGSSMPYGTPFVVSGCGYGSAYTSVVVRSPEALSFAGQSPSNGCISFSNFSTNEPGQYQVDAYQQVHGHSALVASTTFSVS